MAAYDAAMKSESSPLRLALRALLGSVVIVSPFLPAIMHVPGLQSLHLLARLLLFLIPAVCGLSLFWPAEKRLRRGIKNHVWSDAELAHARKVFGSKLWYGLYGAWLLALVVPFIIGLEPMHGVGSLFLLFMLPCQSVMRLAQLLTPPKVDESISGNVLSLKQVRSDHWGEAKHGDEEWLPS